jgi:Domain of unknown function (DUF4281)
MTAGFIFQITSTTAMLGWLVLIIGVISRSAALRDFWAGQICPLGLSALYALLILLFFSKAEGGFGSLDDVKLLFQSDWALLAGWIHYLAFDLFMGALIARNVMADGLNRLWLVLLLPLTFLFGPTGYLATEALRFFNRPRAIT